MLTMTVKLSLRSLCTESEHFWLWWLLVVLTKNKQKANRQTNTTVADSINLVPDLWFASPIRSEMQNGVVTRSHEIMQCENPSCQASSFRTNHCVRNCWQLQMCFRCDDTRTFSLKTTMEAPKEVSVGAVMRYIITGEYFVIENRAKNSTKVCSRWKCFALLPTDFGKSFILVRHYMVCLSCLLERSCGGG